MKKIYKKIIIAIFLIYFAVTLISQQKTLNQYKSEASTYSEQLETAKETNSELQKTKENVNSTEYIEEVATLEYEEWADDKENNKNRRINEKIKKIEIL